MVMPEVEGSKGLRFDDQDSPSIRIFARPTFRSRCIYSTRCSSFSGQAPLEAGG